MNLRHEEGMTALHHAAMHGQVKVLELLRRAGAEMKRESNDGRAPLQCAFEANCPKAVEFLAVETLLNVFNNSGETYLVAATKKGDCVMMSISSFAVVFLRSSSIVSRCAAIVVLNCFQLSWEHRSIRGSVKSATENNSFLKAKNANLFLIFFI